MDRLKRILVSVALLKCILAISQGIPPVNNYSPSDYQAENQNWGISQAENKYIYIANNNGLLEYNGAEWKLYSSPNETILRSVAVIEDKIYTGCYMEFGYWEKDVFGSLQYTSLSDKPEIGLLPDEEFWRILRMEDWVVFQSLKRLYVYNLVNDSVYTIDNSTTLPNIALLDQTVYYYKSHVGIFRIEEGREFLVFDNKALNDDEVAGIFINGNDLIVLTRNNGFFRAEGESLVKWAIAADDLLSRVSIYTSLQLKDQGFAIGTISNGLIHLDKDGNLLYHINQSNGLRNNTVLSLYEDIDQNIWLGLDNGISYADLNSPYLVYRDKQGSVGSVYASAVSNGILYLGTNQGLYFRPLKSSTDFNIIPGTEGQVWSLTTIDQTLFCAHHKGTLVIEGNRARQIPSTKGTWKVSAYSEKSDLLLQGNYDGLYILEKRNGNWQVRNKLEGFDNSAKNFELFNDRIFVNHEYKGIFNVKMDPGLTKSIEVSVDTTLIGHNSGLAQYQGILLYAYRKGVFKYDQDEDKFVRDSLFSEVYTESEYISGKMVADSDNDRLWFFTNPGISYISQGKLGSNLRINRIPIPQDQRHGIMGYESIIEYIENNTYLLGNSSGYISLDLSKRLINEFEVYLGYVNKIGRVEGLIEESALELSLPADLSDKENNLEIGFSSPEYRAFSLAEYQYQLLGIHNEWSNWSNASSVRFDNLPSGDYTFNVRARIGNEMSTNTASFSFNIRPPWYLSNLMLFIYVLLGTITIILIHKLYDSYYQKRQANLIAQNEQEMELAKAENEKEIIRIKNEQLKAENRRKSKELAASTMSIVRKNELLSRVRDYILGNFEKQKDVMPLISIIDKSLNQNDDWELFKEAFNNADQKFLKKLKKLHPNLSPNDIKLCAYLRLNLSSKEIAPLLNISIRSVEIKRYRLRKKLGLKQEDNLANYILEL